MNNKPSPTIETQNFKTACNDLAKAFCKQMDVDYKDTWWVADEQGGVFCFLGGEIFTNAEDMVLTIEYKLTYDEWSEWYYQWTGTDNDCNQLPNRINLRSWIMGARPDDIDKLKQQDNED